MSGQILLKCQGSLAEVTIEHNGKFNAMSRAMWLDLRRVFESIQRDKALRCVVVRGAAGHFCAGGDISEYNSFRFSESSLREFHEDEVWQGLRAMLACDVPVIAHIEGNCMGAGVEIASCCDFRMASDAARFGAPIAKLGFPMAPRELAVVMRAAGELTTREMLLSAAIFLAPELLQRGFLNHVSDTASLHAEVVALAQRIVALAPQAARLNKQTMRALCMGVAASDLISEAYAYADSAEHREGISAFMEKRIAAFNS